MIFDAENSDRKIIDIYDLRIFKQLVPIERVQMPQAAMQIDVQISPSLAPDHLQTFVIYIRRYAQIDVAEKPLVFFGILSCYRPAFYQNRFDAFFAKSAKCRFY